MQDGIIYNYLTAKERGLNTDERKLIYDALDKLTFADLKQFADTHLANKPYTYCIIASEKKINVNDLKKYGDLKTLSLEQIFGY